MSAIEHLKKIAIANYVTSQPEYSASKPEAVERAKKLLGDADDIIAKFQTIIVHGPIEDTACTLTVDAYDADVCWHLSMSVPNAAGPGRTSDLMSGIVLRMFFGTAAVTEGPVEGPFETVRHFRTAYRPE